MTPGQIALVQSSFSRVLPIADTAAALFYARLFELAPQLRPLFRGDMEAQGRKLMHMLHTAVGALGRPEVLVPAARQLGRRHEGYGVQEAHYAVVGTALLDTLAQGLGDAFTDDVREAWTTAYAALSGWMIDGAREGAAPA